MKFIKLFEELNQDRQKVVLFQGSPRDKDTCSNMDSKTHAIVEYVVDKYSDVFDFDVIDLSVNVRKQSIIQPCKGCISTAGGYHCHFECDCYSKNSETAPDFMHDEDVYKRLKESDAFIVFTPIHWYSVTTQVKSLFDRLVCINQTLTREDALRVLGKGNLKNSEITGNFAKSGEFNHLLKNHLEGKFAAFYVHGDDGANDYFNKPMPKSYTKEDFTPINAVMPIVYQCRYSGINVPDDLIKAFYINKGKDYYSANLDLQKLSRPYDEADNLMESLKRYISK
jgi:multimeric flavodoxin WrbA